MQQNGSLGINYSLTPFEAVKCVCPSRRVQQYRPRVSSSKKVEWIVRAEMIQLLPNTRECIEAGENPLSKFTIRNRCYPGIHPARNLPAMDRDALLAPAR